MDLGLAGRTALVTGAHRGTGAAIAKGLAAEGATVLVHGHELGQADATVAAIVAAGGTARALAGDLMSDAGAAAVAEAAGAVDVLVNNYGVANRGSWTASGADEWHAMYERNVLSAVRLTQALVPGMKARRWGRIIHLGTIGSTPPAARMPAYYAAKGALATMSVSLAQELAETGITVNTVSPGYVRTEQVEAAYRRRAATLGWGSDWREIERHIVASDFPNPCGRLAERQEVADLVAFLCSPRAGFINGQNVRIDGGAVCHV